MALAASRTEEYIANLDIWIAVDNLGNGLNNGSTSMIRDGVVIDHLLTKGGWFCSMSASTKAMPSSLIGLGTCSSWK